ncbi:hypothetical protein, partial [Vibrio cortegadensis]|uniref:hypothetical protein n=1 Tax=Vibrio cortegadensis TaxID=1328770 RepID=UPI00352FCC04
MTLYQKYVSAILMLLVSACSSYNKSLNTTSERIEFGSRAEQVDSSNPSISNAKAPVEPAIALYADESNELNPEPQDKKTNKPQPKSKIVDKNVEKIEETPNVEPT